MCDSYKLPIGETVTTKKGEKGFLIGIFCHGQPTLTKEHNSGDTQTPLYTINIIYTDSESNAMLRLFATILSFVQFGYLVVPNGIWEFRVG